MSEIILTKSNFADKVINSDKPVLVDFWATWCGPCKMLAPVLEEIANERDDILVGKINIDDEPELAMQYKIVSIPTIMLVKEGAVAEKVIGYRTKEQLLEELGL